MASLLVLTLAVRWWRTDRATSSIREGSIVLLGDSITAEGDWGSLLPDSPVVNRGHAGYTSAQLVPIAERIARRQPRAVYILAGTNDIRDGHPARWTRAQLERIIDAIRERSPATTVVVQTVLPRSDAPDAVRAINTQIAQLAEQRGVEVLELYVAFDDGTGGLRPAETTDGIHLSATGYERWAAVLSTAFDAHV